MEEKHPPKLCPQCGSDNIHYVEQTDNRGSIVWDTYCYGCYWSGDIRPDSDLDYYGLRNQGLDGTVIR